jgi:hypothetical protein
MSLKNSYEELENLMNGKSTDEEVGDKFEEILDKAFEVLNQAIENEKFLHIENEEELFTVRAMFDYMMELWAENHLEEAKAICYDMAYLVEDEKLKNIFGYFALGMLDKIGVDKFLDKYVDTQNVEDGYEFFFTDFNDELEELIIKHKSKFEEEFNK